jgi:hypothetical protein
MNKKIEYCKNLRKDFTAYYVEIVYDEETCQFDYVYFYDFENGIIEIKEGKKEVHRWESEKEAQSGSYLSRRFTAILLDGITTDNKVEEGIIKNNYEILLSEKANEEDMKIVNKAIEYIKTL